jgi:alkylhydroperoxidase/carboxymuconolactone decarboxylase family protein YurZ
MSITNTKSLQEVIAAAVAPRVRQSLQKQAEDQFHPHSETTDEVSPPDHYVTNKFKHRPETFAPAGVSSYGQQQRRDLLDQPNIGPIPDKASSDLPTNLSSKDDIPGNHLYDVLDTMETAAGKVAEPTAQGPAVSDKLSLKESSYTHTQIKEASLHVQQGLQEIQAQGQQIIDLLLSAASTVSGQNTKQASAGNSALFNTVTADAVTESLKLASDDARDSALTSWAEIIDDAIYAAEGTALALKTAADEELQNAEGLSAPDVPPVEDIPIGDVNGEQAMDAMTDPAAQSDIPPEEAEALLQQSLMENGVDPSAALDEGLADESGLSAEEGLPAEEGASPEEAEAFVQALLESGVTPEEIQEAAAELSAEGDQGIDPAEGAAVDEEAVKTGSYKFASFIERRTPKTASQESRSAIVRGAMRELIYGPRFLNFT